MKNCYILLFLVIFLTACNNNKSRNEKTYSDSKFKLKRIDLTAFIEKPDRLKGISSIADSISYVCLKTSSEEPIDLLLNIALTNDNILVQDRKQSVYIFNRSGKYIRKINHRGRGPNEYNNAIFAINEENKVIGFLSASDQKVLLYDFNDRWLKTLNLNNTLQGIEGDFSLLEWIGKDLYVLKNTFITPMKLDTSIISSIVINSNGALVSKHKYYPMEVLPAGFRGSSNPDKLHRINEGVLASEYPIDTVYLVNHNGLRLPYIVFNYGQHRAPRVLNVNPKEDIKYFTNLSYIVCGDYVFIQFFYKGVTCQGFWDLTKEKALRFPDNGIRGGIEDDLDGGPAYNPSFAFRNYFDGDVLDVINPFNLKNYNSLKKGSELEKLKDNVDINDNPILRIIHLKAKIE